VNHDGGNLDGLELGPAVIIVPSQDCTGRFIARSTDANLLQTRSRSGIVAIFMISSLVKRPAVFSCLEHSIRGRFFVLTLELFSSVKSASGLKGLLWFRNRASRIVEAYVVSGSGQTRDGSFEPLRDRVVVAQSR
jgi:hypothetical protein